MPFGYLLQTTGIWPTTRIYLFALSMVCLVWMHLVIRRMTVKHSPELAQRIE